METCNVFEHGKDMGNILGSLRDVWEIKSLYEKWLFRNKLGNQTAKTYIDKWASPLN